MAKINTAIVEALRSLESQGKLDPADVVEAARDETSPLHDRFTWDDGEAAHQFRLHEARNLINVCVEMLPGAKESSPVWVSLRQDRSAGGYRPLVRVLSHAEQRAALLADAIKDMDHFRSKYHMLKELASVFAAMRKVKK